MPAGSERPGPTETLLDLIRKAFPAQPVPERFFWPACRDRLDLDIPVQLAARIAGRAWPDVSALDWRMIAPPDAFKAYVDPGAYLYYLPSFLAGALAKDGDVDFALEAITPNNHQRSPRGAWWEAFWAAATVEQRNTVSAFLAHLRRGHWDYIGLANQDLVRAGEAIWTEDKR